MQRLGVKSPWWARPQSEQGGILIHVPNDYHYLSPEALSSIDFKLFKSSNLPPWSIFTFEFVSHSLTDNKILAETLTGYVYVLRLREMEKLEETRQLSP